MPQPTPQVFLNCPIDTQFKPLSEAMAFAVIDCGFDLRCALESSDASKVRIDKISGMISECEFGIHDISRTELDHENNLPRFNMPLELGLFLGAQRFGGKKQRRKSCLILDKEPYRYQKFISDIAGQDIKSHGNDPHKAIVMVRDWLNDSYAKHIMPGGSTIIHKYERFLADLPGLCAEVKVQLDEMTFNNYQLSVSEWLSQNS